MISTERTFAGFPALADVYKLLRRNLPQLAAGTVAAALLWWHPEISEEFRSGRWKADAFYEAVFDWSSIQAAFLFGIYAFFLSRSEPFIKAISETQPFQQLRSYVLRTLRLTMALSVISLPALVATPAAEGAGYALITAMTAALTYTFFSFLKVVRVFGKIERIK
jgi:hypothetical protein